MAVMNYASTVEENMKKYKKIKIQLNLSTFSVVSHVGFMSLFNNTFSIS